MATGIETIISGINRDLPTAKVYRRPTWDATWVEEPELWCNWCAHNMAPAISEAELVYHYGQIQRPGATTFINRPKLDLRNKYVKIVIPVENGGSPIVWYGVVVGESDEQFGVDYDDHNEPVEAGNQRFVCYGMEWLLTRKIITSSVAWGILGTGDDDMVTIDRAIPFNEYKGNPNETPLADRGNMRAAHDANVGDLFSDDLTPGAALPWFADQIVEHLLRYQCIENGAGDRTIRFVLDSDSVNSLAWYNPTVQCEGRTLFDVLNQVIDRKRGLGWSTTVDEEDDIVVIRVHTFTEADIDLPDGNVFPRNRDLRTLNYDRVKDVMAVVHYDEATKYDQVLARGARRTSVFTVSAANGNLLPDWSNESGYRAGASLSPGYGGLPVWQQELRSDGIRQSDKFQRVYSYFRINKTVAATGNYIFPKLDPESGDPLDEGENLWFPGLRLSSSLTLKEHHDYSDVEDITSTLPTDAQAEYIRPFALIKIDDTRYQYIDRLANAGAYSESLGDGGLDFSCSLRMQENAPGFVVKTSGLAHLIAKGTFDVVPPERSAVQAQLDYRTMHVTVCMTGDSYAKASYPVTADPFAEYISTLVIDIGERARLDYLVPGTTIGLDDGEPVTTNGGFIRDDRDLLKAVARIAYTWYSEPRTSLDLTYRQITGAFQVGHLITKTGGEEETEQAVNSVITSVRHDLLAGTTAVKTKYGELDFAGLLI